jgi:hypothetical protein
MASLLLMPGGIAHDEQKIIMFGSRKMNHREVQRDPILVEFISVIFVVKN